VSRQAKRKGSVYKPEVKGGRDYLLCLVFVEEQCRVRDLNSA
jgi:hypothetical protein